MSRQSPLDHPTEGEARRSELADLLAAGARRPDIARAFGVHVDTISTWTGRADIQAMVTERIRQRANRMVRSIDATIEGKLQHAEKLDIKDLLDIRRALVPARMDIRDDRDRDAALEELAQRELNRLAEPEDEPAPVDDPA
jgi:phage portal protein BeeE